MEVSDASPAISYRRTITWSWLTGFILLLLGFSLLIAWADATRKLDRLLHDGWVRLSQREPPADIVIVAIDPESLGELGRWPWPRRLQTRLFDALASARPRAAVIDILYVEPAAAPVDDQSLAAAISRLPIAVLPVLTERRSGLAERLPVASISRVTDGLGHIFLPIDDDGIVRRIFLKSGFRQAHWSALGLEVQTLMSHQEVEERESAGKTYPRATDPARLVGRRVAPGSGSLPDILGEFGTASREHPSGWVQDHEVLIPFAGPSGQFRQVSAADIIAGRVDAAALRDKVVFVGLTTTGLSDVVPTPVSALNRPMPGIEIHANVFAGLREGVMVTPLSPYAAVLLALLLLPGMVWWYSRTAPQWALFGAVAAAALPIFLSFVAYRWLHWWFAPLAASVPVLLSYLAWSWHRLDFVNRFLERESRRLAPHGSQPEDQSVQAPPGVSDTLPEDRTDQTLTRFLDHAMEHLPIRAWSVTASGRNQGGGAPLTLNGAGTPVAQWQRFGSVYRRRYRTPDALQVRLDISDQARAPEILRFVDSLPEIRIRQQPVRPSGSIERLQGNVLRLAAQTAALRHVQSFTETVMAGSPAGSGVWNAAGESVHRNALLHDLVSGLPPTASLRQFLEVLGRQPGGADREKVNALLLDGEPWQLTYHEEQCELVINLNAVGDTLADRLICATVVDVSQIRSVERSRAEMMEYLSHDLRSPLVSALYLLDDEESAVPGVVAGVADDSASRERREDIGARIRQSLKMMEDLLHMARADSLDASTFQEVYLNGVIDASIDEFGAQARSLEVALIADMPDIDIWVAGDASLLERAFKNVIGNALKFSKQGGEVTVQLRAISMRVEVAISDQGVGIAPDMLDRLFTRFIRDEGRKARGFGLGLALVSQVVQQHRGTVWATSSSSGSRITLRFPRKP